MAPDNDSASDQGTRIEAAARFDPYHKWLGIPPDEQPPNHYRLLGIPLFESEREVIRNAADQRMAYLKTFGAGQHSRLSQELLNEVSVAKVCLLNDAKRRAYDEPLSRSGDIGASHQETGVEEPLVVAKPNAQPESPSFNLDINWFRQVGEMWSAWIRAAGRGRRWRLVAMLATVGAVTAVLLIAIYSPEGPLPPLGGGQNGSSTERKPAPSRSESPPDLAISPFDAHQAARHQEAWAEYLSVQAEVVNSVGMTFRLIPPGKFQMGSAKSESDRENDEFQHRVRITKPFYLSVCEVTQEEYERVMERNPSYFSSVADQDTCRFPVENVTWDEAVEFCSKLSSLPEEQRMGRRYRLPTEAEWEYACRAGTTTRFSFDEANLLSDYAWYAASATQPVGQKEPNAWGVYDMHGNVWEWCQDWYAADYYAKLPVDDPQGPATGSLRVNRGGSWDDPAPRGRSAYRNWENLSFHSGSLGFRVTLVLAEEGAGSKRQVSPGAV